MIDKSNIYMYLVSIIFFTNPKLSKVTVVPSELLDIDIIHFNHEITTVSYLKLFWYVWLVWHQYISL